MIKLNINQNNFNIKTNDSYNTGIGKICIILQCLYSNINTDLIDYWIKYHSKLGVHDFYAYCFDDDEKIIKWIDNHPKLKTPNNIIHYNGGDKYNCGQKEAIKRGFELTKHDYHFGIFMDTDEFIYIPKMYDTLQELLKYYNHLDHISLGIVNYSYKKGIPENWNINENFILERCWFREKLPYSYKALNEKEREGYCPCWRGKRKIIINYNKNKTNPPFNIHSLDYTKDINYPNINEFRINEYRGITIIPTEQIGNQKEDDEKYPIMDSFLIK